MKKYLIWTLPLVIAFVSCSEERKKINESEVDLPQDSVQVDQQKPKVSFYQYEDAEAYPDAILELYTPLGNQVFKPGKVPFEFNIKNYPFEEEASDRFLLFNILNGDDPNGFRSPIFQRDLKEGSYRVVAYLVDEEGLALKNFGNYVDRDFQVGDSRPFPYSAEPYLAVNLPINNQIVDESRELIVDFLVVGGEMRLDGLKVQVQVGEYSYEIDHMAPIRVANLPAGTYQMQIKLLRTNGEELSGPFSSVSKVIIVR